MEIITFSLGRDTIDVYTTQTWIGITWWIQLCWILMEFKHSSKRHARYQQVIFQSPFNIVLVVSDLHSYILIDCFL
jgi:hypothetical protein